MSFLFQDLRDARRRLIRERSFTVTAVLTLALGIASTSAVFNLIQGVLLTPPPYPEPEKIVLINPAKTDGQAFAVGATGTQWSEWRKEAHSFAAMAGYIWTFDYLISTQGSEFFQGLEVTPDYFKVVGTRPLLGRTLLESDASPKGYTVIVLGYNFWQRRFNGDPHVLGQTLKITRAQPPLVIVGVMPPAVRFLPAFSSADFPNYDINAVVDYWVPITPDHSESLEWNVAGRLRDGVSLRQAQAELTALAARQAQATPKWAGITARAQLLETELNRDGRKLLGPLLGAVLLVFLIACGNVGGLLLTRGLQRQQEYALRCALGAPRSRLFRQALTESSVLALLGGGLGALLAVGTIALLKAIGGAAIPRLDAVTISWPMMICCFAASIVAAAVAGFVPALRVSRLDPAQGLKGAGPTASASRAERRLVGGVAALQMALTLALLVGAGLLMRTVHNLARVRPGFDTENILTLSVTLPTWEGKPRYDFHVRSLERVAALPGVRDAAFCWGLPLTGDKWTDSVTIEEQPGAERLGDALIVAKRSVTPHYFAALGIPILAGRSFRASDNLQNWKAWPDPAPGETPSVCIINQAMAERCFPNRNAVGRMIRVGPWRKRPCTIVGVAANTRTEALTQGAAPEIYVPFLQGPVFTKHLIVRTTSSDPQLLASAVRQELRALAPTVSIEQVQTFEEIRARSVASQTFAMRLLGGFSMIASVLALVGIYGVLSLSVGSRRREIAIRMAIGAQQRCILGLVIREGARWVGLGIILGAGIAMALAQMLKALLFRVEPTDLMTLVGVILLFTGAALVACWIPARRATQVDPMEALRYE